MSAIQTPMTVILKAGDVIVAEVENAALFSHALDIIINPPPANLEPLHAAFLPPGYRVFPTAQRCPTCGLSSEVPHPRSKTCQPKEPAMTDTPAEVAEALPPLPKVDGYDKRVEGHYSADTLRRYAREYAGDLERQLAALQSARDAAADLEHDDKRDDPEFWWTVAAFRAVELARQIERAEAAERQLAEARGELAAKDEAYRLQYEACVRLGDAEERAEAAESQLAAQRERDGRVDEAMVDRAFAAFHGAPIYPTERDRIRAAIDAALKDRP